MTRTVPLPNFECCASTYANGTLSLTKRYVSPNGRVPASLSYLGEGNGHSALDQRLDDGDPTNNGSFRLWPGEGANPGLEHKCSQAPPVEAGVPAKELVPVLSPRAEQERKRHGC